MRWSINKLASSLNKKYRPVYAAVQRLIKKDILEKNQNNLLIPRFKETLIFEYAERKRFSEIKDKDLKIIKKRIEQVDDSFFSAVLFGSSVKKKGNDIDILFIIPDSEDTDKFELKIRKMLGSYENIIDLNIINEKSCYEMLNMPNQLNVMNEIMKNHLVILGDEGFYRIIRRWKNDG